ncbi:MAG: NAD-dependent protein deacylase [Mogibacterium sp.]|nr:NAD-dependent protein deacylase [Mogibacterium sp.]
MDERKFQQFQQLVDSHSRIVFFGGAGVSTASGIPDFRSADGLYNTKDIRFEQYEPEYLLSHECLYREPKVFFEFYRQKMDVRGIEPNVTHYRLAELERAGKLSAVVTQNIDGLHQKAGSRTVYEIHGTTTRSYCTKCGRVYPEAYLFECGGDIPRCESCGGMVRPDVTMYGESLPEEAFSRAFQAINQADMLIIAGTSLVVYPAAGMVNYFRGDALVLLNMQPTARDRGADLVIRDPMQEVFERLVVRESGSPAPSVVQ